MAEIIKAPRGMFDVLPEEMPLWRRLEDAARDAFRRYGYGEVRTPLLEETRLFVRGIGDTTDIVEKEMYTFPSKTGEESLTLRPEATAGMVRAYLEHNYHKTAPFQKFGYMGPMFRYERPQAGRQRQFNQIGAEVFGTYAPEADVETIAMALDILEAAGLSGTRLKVNSIGCRVCRPVYREVVKGFIGDRMDRLCPDCKRRFDRNVFRVLDCKVEACRALIADLPPVEGYLDAECAAHFEGVKRLLDMAGVDYIADKFLVRGFDYYTRTVYEMAHPSLGARDAVAGGGRYDNLVEDLGGPATGAVGFSIGEEATLLAMKNSGVATGAAEEPHGAFIIAIEPAAAGEAFRLLQELRSGGVEADMLFDGRSVKAQMRAANRRNARVTVILGPDEIASGTAKVKDMTGGEEKSVTLAGVAEAVRVIVAGK